MSIINKINTAVAQLLKDEGFSVVGLNVQYENNTVTGAVANTPAPETVAAAPHESNAENASSLSSAPAADPAPVVEVQPQVTVTLSGNLKGTATIMRGERLSAAVKKIADGCQLFLP